MFVSYPSSVCKIDHFFYSGLCTINKCEGQETYAIGLSRNQVYVDRSRKDNLTCRICKKPLRLDGNITTDENGNPFTNAVRSSDSSEHDATRNYPDLVLCNPSIGALVRR